MIKPEIKKLAQDAGIYFGGHPMNPLSVYPSELQRFADLIVRSVLEQGVVLANHYIDSHPEQDQTMLLASIADYSNEIRKHFGVEE